jgi:nucleotide-binding universal stress UspA family protein
MTATSNARVIVGVDGSSESEQALRWAADFAESSGARLVVITAWDYPATIGWAAWPQGWDPSAASRVALIDTVERVFGTNRPKDIELMVQQGSAAGVLLEQSEGAAMLVVGSRGHGGFAGMLLGSVSANVAEHAHCPVLVMHADKAPVDPTLDIIP